MFGTIVMLVFGLFIIGLSIYLVYRAIFTKRFHKTEGVVISSDIKIEYGTDEAGFEPLIHYEYSVRGKKFQNSKYSISPNMSKRKVERIVAAYKPGSQIDVFYNPNKPNDSVILVGMSFGNLIGIFIIVSLLLYALIEMLFL